jgi:GTPase SAR1 family protein
VPELPDVMAERPEMLTEMRYFLLGAEGSAGTVALSSEKRSKVAAHGQGGVGKTTMAAAVVRDSSVRSAFDRIGTAGSLFQHNVRALTDTRVLR